MIGLGITLGIQARSGSGGPTAPTITSSDGDPASLTDNGDGTFDVIIDGVNIGTITQAQINAGGWITVVEPVAGMSGDDVVLTTTGHAIYVGSVSIETDVEVLANEVAVGTSLPFDATAHPGTNIIVRWTFSVGFGTDLVLESAARIAPPKIIQFRDSNMNFGGVWTPGSNTRKATFAMRIKGVVSSSGGVIASAMRTIVLGPIQIDNQSSGLRIINPGYSAPSFVLVAGGAAVREVSLLAAIDYDRGLPGGEEFVVWVSIDGGAPTRLGGYNSGLTPPALTQGIGSFGSQNSSTQGGVFDLERWVWMSNQALDPATHFSSFFDNDGLTKNLGTSGVVGGVTPLIYMIEDDFLTGNNRGSLGGTIAANRTPVVVV